jgi:hypothetical protein
VCCWSSTCLGCTVLCLSLSQVSHWTSNSSLKMTAMAFSSNSNSNSNSCSSSAGAETSASPAARMHLNFVVMDGTTTVEQKEECVSHMTVVWGSSVFSIHVGMCSTDWHDYIKRTRSGDPPQSPTPALDRQHIPSSLRFHLRVGLWDCSGHC